MQIAYVVYDGFTALDLIGPYEVLSRWPDAEIHVVSSGEGPVATDMGLRVLPTDTPATLPRPDLIVIPGAEDPLPVLEDDVLVDWVRDASATATWCASACTGAALYAKAGVLTGRRATTHWAFREGLRAMGVDVVAERVVVDGKVITGAGVSAGIDMALTLTAMVHGEERAKALQLAIEYDPQPPFSAGSPDTASASTLRLALRMLLGDAPLHRVAGIARHTVRSLATRPG
ncbi:DJ-1/PfpI family protein [Conexibacter sp. SYSU D00693]|uniref:DJ-1/PfpI family protein n=1 Tax=Conexibacter sp. SYSU D00693 TaxID=2812560 RepID=UPI00196AC597|nr:DJ-1/PfpI family protein [Conexibacter sp. SYSU D00693]